MLRPSPASLLFSALLTFGIVTLRAETTEDYDITTDKTKERLDITLARCVAESKVTGSALEHHGRKLPGAW